MASANTRLWRHVLLVAAVCLLNVCLVCEGAILPVAYKVGQQLRVEGNSYQTDERILPYDFYRMPQCKPPRAVISEYRASQSIGQIIMGSRPYPTSYIMTVGENITLCHNVCAVDFLPKHIRQGRTLLKNGYRGQFTLDGLPVLELRADGRYAEGYTVGQENHWNTHFTFTVMYTPAGGSDTDVYITGFFVEPRSVPCDEDTTGRVQLEDGIWRDEAVMLSYTLKWELDPDHTYETRWERYEHTIAEKSARKRGHWVSLVNSTCFVLLLGGVAAVIIAGTIRRDLALYAGDLADAVEDRGWKLLGGDVFRPPEQVVIFCGLLGSGAQIITLISLVFVAGGIHLLRISHRSGALLNGCIFFFFVASMVNGIVSGAMLKYFKKNTWRNGVQCVLLLPLSLSGGYMTLNMIYWIRRSSRAIPFSIVIFLICALVLCYVPMAILGLKMGFAKGVSSVEKVSAIPRMIPVVDSFAQAALLYLPGLVPFSAIFVEVTLVLSSMWKHETFYAAGVLCLMFFMVSLITAELSIVVTYARLCREDHRWWWGSFISCGSISIYLFLYSIVYLKMYLRIRSVSTIILYLGYMAGFSAIIGVTTGTIGVLCSYIFVKKLYIGQRVV